MSNAPYQNFMRRKSSRIVYKNIHNKLSLVQTKLKKKCFNEEKRKLLDTNEKVKHILFLPNFNKTTDLTGVF